MHARKALALAITVLLCAACAGSTVRRGVTVPKPKDRPNIVMIMADDLDAGTDLTLFPNLRKLIGQSTTFGNFIVTDSWCCPSRASIMLSEYVHSHGVKTNSWPDGGFSRFAANGETGSTVGTWLHDAGYDTAMIGKYLNNYPGQSDPDYVPPGWTDWQAGTGGAMYNQFGYRLVNNGVSERHGHQPKDYLDDVLTTKATQFIVGRPKDKPFFLYLTPLAPHLPATAAPRYAGAFPNAKVPRTPAFNQASVADEPRFISRHRKLTPKKIRDLDLTYRQRLRSLLAVDDMVGAVMTSLRETGRLKNTYVMFTSDNGFHLGQHRLNAGKTTAYETDIRVPLIVFGPGITAGRRVDDIASTVDLAPTFAAWAGARTPATVEGRSLLPLLKGEHPSDWRAAALVEFYSGHPADDPAGPDCDSAIGEISGCPAPPTYAAIRTARYTYVEYVTGERQLFDRQADPEELSNIVRTADPRLIADLKARLAALRACSGATCRTADRGV